MEIEKDGKTGFRHIYDISAEVMQWQVTEAGWSSPSNTLLQGEGARHRPADIQYIHHLCVELRGTCTK